MRIPERVLGRLAEIATRRPWWTVAAALLLAAAALAVAAARLELKTGLEHSMGEYLSGRLTLGAQFDNLRFALFYFNGYGRDPATYHLRTEYAGLGLELR